MTDDLHKGRGRTRAKMTTAVAAGIVVAVAVGLLNAWHYAIIAGWAAACIVYIAWVWLSVWRLDGASTKDHATLEDPGRRTTDLVLLLASLASVVAVVYILVDAKTLKGGAQLGVALLAVVSVALSWTLVHTVYALRYARIFYRTGGGIDFNQKEPPRYSDFAYLAFTLGMTFQVSDTNIQNAYIRATVLRHTLLSYLFGTVIVAATVNLVAGLT
ncbi:MULTISPECIES: DUF1345 domain-containing protein [unclassified Leifsonia]|uniref:DUF1345 domain-containing protein n=2 Tax=unclassified Leifsonia TaxID=2663824 RepID=UPI0003829D1B|nr:MULTISPECIES: DUF1345 domain-containing protein [unclassified Leifsonia]TDP99758.1 putative membrane protein [Leifsonia sp. 115AMFTsu3.1]